MAIRWKRPLRRKVSSAVLLTRRRRRPFLYRNAHYRSHAICLVLLGQRKPVSPESWDESTLLLGQYRTEVALASHRPRCQGNGRGFAHAEFHSGANENLGSPAREKFPTTPNGFRMPPSRNPMRLIQRETTVRWGLILSDCGGVSRPHISPPKLIIPSRKSCQVIEAENQIAPVRVTGIPTLSKTAGGHF
jgi:hypothetical protein